MPQYNIRRKISLKAEGKRRRNIISKNIIKIYSIIHLIYLLNKEENDRLTYEIDQ